MIFISCLEGILKDDCGFLPIGFHLCKDVHASICLFGHEVDSRIAVLHHVVLHHVPAFANEVSEWSSLVRFFIDDFHHATGVKLYFDGIDPFLHSQIEISMNCPTFSFKGGAVRKSAIYSFDPICSLVSISPPHPALPTFLQKMLRERATQLNFFFSSLSTFTWS